jgi:hypothetical protein
LGGWSVAKYDEILYLQSGLAWLRNGDEWLDKRRGLDPESFSLPDAVSFLRTLEPNASWNPFVGKTKRFIGLGAALQSSAPLKVTHCRWVTNDDRKIKVGARGKRIHVSSLCVACQKGATAYEYPHTLVVHPNSAKHPQSYPHSIPWEKEDGHAEWRDYESQLGDIRYD